MKAKHGLKVTFQIGPKIIDWKVHIAPMRDSVLLGPDLMKAHNVVIHTRGKVPVNITDTVASGSVATTMEKRMPVRLCNFSTSKAALPKSACLGVLLKLIVRSLRVHLSRMPCLAQWRMQRLSHH